MPVIQSKTIGSGEAPRQANQPSRKGKKAWRKNVDVSEVQKGLVELNEEIIRGGVIKEKASEDLFTLDVKGDAQLTKRSKHVKKTLKADEILAQRSAVPAVSMRKRPSDKTTNGLIPAKRQRTSWVSHKELSRLKRVADGQHDNTIDVKDATYDVWGTTTPALQADVDDFLPHEEKPKAPKTMNKAPISLLENGKQVAAVQTPSGGYSYNPVFTDYEERLAEESEKALEAERKRLAVEAADRQKQEAAARSAAEAEAAEARADLSEWEEDSEWEGFQSGGEDVKLTAKRPERKTQTQRNRIKRRKEEERLAKHKAASKAQRRQEHRIKEIADEVEEEDRNRQLILAVESDDEVTTDLKEHKLRRKQLGKYKLPEGDLEFVLPDELQESLRLLKPEGNLLKDRYRSMLVRGKVESRRHLPFHRKAARKYTEKWTYKDFKI
ncbi:ribosome biogenesis protein Nop53/GLTSCR2 [Dactylonectria macrodidyma]|uniref:Ribosome biogenesis protein NOP53 n=1 Tax=Dactylonectria macrodidyma TaxID=307937 RepID=A0A9P9FR26_9HYPO|nr:ribosome biogenesis protein Nop53/GLTSCR2 [Dactylonectria macrodidyma]